MEKPKIFWLLASRKFWACVIGILFVLIKAYYPDFPVQEEQILTLVLILASYILGIALEDGLSNRD